MEKGFAFEPRVEREPGFAELRGAFGGIVRNGTKEELAKLIDKFPQRDRQGRLVWLLTSGMAVELATGDEREHHDLDIVVMDPKNIGEWEILGTDNVTPGQYWADMDFDPKYLTKTACKTSFEVGQRDYGVEIVHPAIIAVQKLSRAFGREPREKDTEDARNTFKWWAKNYGERSTWINVANRAVKALPVREQTQTIGRVNDIVPKTVPRKR